ncbi:MAG: GAF domain-containing protein [Anaerolineae bacterium]|nr:GAF domain-containing protein [Anaerolineae bacterium]
MRSRPGMHLLIWLAGLLALSMPAPSAAAPPHKAVLLLFPYQLDLPAYTLSQQTIQKEFGQTTDLALDLYYEYADLGRFSDEAYRSSLFAHYALKYRGRQIDLVMVCSESMLDLWLEHRREILPDAPVVFYDIVTERVAARQSPSDVTGVTGVVDHAQSVHWFLRANPAVNEVVIVHGVGAADRAYLQPVDDLKADLQGQVQVTDWADLPMEEIKRRAADLSKTSVIAYHLMFEDAAGVAYRPIDALRELAAVSAVPVLSGYDQFIGTGTVGGYMYSIEQQARAAARMGLRILHGEPASAIPMLTENGNRFIFDHPAMRRYGIPLSTLPPESIVKNRQYSIWEQYRPQLIGLGVGVAGLIILAVYLGILTRRLGAARRALSQLNVNLESQVKERTADLSQANRRLEEQAAERKQAEEIIRLRLRLFEFAADHSLDELMQKALDEIEEITHSSIGFYHFVEADQKTLSLQAWSTRTMQEFCKAEGKGMHYSLDQAGVWVDCVYQRKPVIHNDYAALPHRKGMPPGHAEVRRELVVPTMREGRIVSILGVGNKPADYNEKDVELVAYVADIVWSIVERKRAEEQMQDYQHRLEAQNAELEAFAHTVAHDLKNPLGILIGYGKVLEMDLAGTQNAPARESIDTIVQTSLKMNALVDDLLLLSSVRQVDQVELSPLDMADIVAEAQERLRPRIAERQAEIILPATWPAALGYEPWIEQVWVNYLDNAIKYGGHPPRVEVGADVPPLSSPLRPEGKEGEMARFWVRDNGDGLSEQEQARLFAPFERLGELRVKGHGLGLSIVRRIVEKLGGEVGVESAPGQGSVFYFTLPLAAPPS